MLSKEMLVFYGEDCLPYKDSERQVHYPIVGNSFLGASNTTRIKFYIDKIGSTDDTWVANAKLPNGKMGSKILTTGTDENGGYALLELSSFYTQAKGDIYISLNGFYGQVQINETEEDVYEIEGIPTIQATGAVKIAINYATPLTGSDEVEEITLAQVLDEVGTKLDRNSQNYVKSVNENDYSFDSTRLNKGDLVITRDTKEFAKINNNEELEHTSLGVEGLRVHGEQFEIYPEGDQTTMEASDDLTISADGTVHIGSDNQDVEVESDVGDLSLEANDGKALLSGNSVEVKTTSGGDMEIKAVDGNVKVVADTLKFNNKDVATEGYVQGYVSEQIAEIDYSNFFKKYESIVPTTNGTLNIGDGEHTYNELYLSGKINKNSNNYGLLLPNTTSFTSDETLATEDYVQDYAYSKEEINTKLTSMLVYKGSLTVAQLNTLAPTLGETQTGWFYNVSDSGTLNAGNVQVLAGDNVAWTGSSWDKLTMDLSVYNETFLAAGFLQASEIDSVPEVLIFDDNGDITNPNWTGDIDIDYMSPPITDISISQVPDTLHFDTTQNYDNMITDDNWTGIMTITY